MKDNEPKSACEEIEFRKNRAWETYRRYVGQLAEETYRSVAEIIAEDVESDQERKINPNDPLVLVYQTPDGPLKFKRTKRESSDYFNYIASSPHKEGEIKLTPTEGLYLGALMQDPRGIFPPSELDNIAFPDIANEPDGSPDQRVRVYMSRLRNKLGDTLKSPIIYTVDGGYTLTPPTGAKIVFLGRKKPPLSQIS